MAEPHVSGLKPNLAHEVTKALNAEGDLGEALMVLADSGYWTIAEIYQETCRQQHLGADSWEVYKDATIH